MLISNAERSEEYNGGDQVMLATSDISFTTGSKKLLAKYIGPYTIIEKVFAGCHLPDSCLFS